HGDIYDHRRRVYRGAERFGDHGRGDHHDAAVHGGYGSGHYQREQHDVCIGGERVVHSHSQRLPGFYVYGIRRTAHRGHFQRLDWSPERHAGGGHHGELSAHVYGPQRHSPQFHAELHADGQPGRNDHQPF